MVLHVTEPDPAPPLAVPPPLTVPKVSIRLVSVPVVSAPVITPVNMSMRTRLVSVKEAGRGVREGVQ